MNLLITSFFSTVFLLRFGDKQRFTCLSFNDLQKLSPNRHIRQNFDSHFSAGEDFGAGSMIFLF